MISWGILSAATAFVTGPHSFVALRLLLGAAEAGLVPGVLLYITYWFPDVLRGRAVAIFLVAAPVSNVVSALLSVPLLGMNGFAGLGGWQWLLIIEAVPAILLGLITAFVMTNKPSDATWLDNDEKSWLQRRLDSETPAPTGAKPRIWQTVCKPRVLALAFIYALRNVGAFGITFFLPQIVRDLGLSNTEIGVANSVSYLVAIVGMVLWGPQLRPDRRAPLAFDGIDAAGGRGACLRGVARRLAMVARRACDRQHRILRLPTLHLRDLAERAGSGGSGRRHRLHQLLRANRIDRRPPMAPAGFASRRRLPGCAVLHGRVFDSGRGDCRPHQGTQHGTSTAAGARACHALKPFRF